MFRSAKPSWLTKPDALNEVLKHNFFLPPDIGTFTSLQETDAFSQGVRQFIYWRGQLLPSLTSQTIFLAFLGPKGLVQPNVAKVYEGLLSICDTSQLLEVQTGANTNFLALSFKTPDVIVQILTQFVYFDNMVVLHIASHTEVHHRFRLLWLPPLFSISRVHHLLNSITQSHRLRRESIGVAEAVFSPTNIVSGVLSLKDGQTINDLPYLIKLPTPHKGCALLTIDNRQPICLKCRALGHTRRQCSMIKCSTCSKVHFPNAPCGVSSYSSVAARNVTSLANDTWLEFIPESKISLDTSSVIAVDNVTPTDESSFLSSSQILGPTDGMLDVGTLPSAVSIDNNTTPPICSFSGVVSNEYHECDRTHLDCTISPESDINTPLANTASYVSPIVLNDKTSESVVTDLKVKSSYKSQKTSVFDTSVHHCQSKLSLKSSHITQQGILFGDPDLTTCFDSSSDSAPDLAAVAMEVAVHTSISGAISPSRKRKISSSGSSGGCDPFLAGASSFQSVDSPPSLLTPPECEISPQEELPVYTFHGPLPSEDIPSLIITMMELVDDEFDQLLAVCPNGALTLPVARHLGRLHRHGFYFEDVMLHPHLLTSSSSDLRDWIIRKTEENRLESLDALEGEKEVSAPPTPIAWGDSPEIGEASSDLNPP